MNRIDSFTGEYKFLSNFYLSPVEYEGTIYPSVEHAYQAAKTLDMSVRASILFAETPAKAKKLGRNVVLRPNWKDVKYNIMANLVRYKFSSNFYLYEKLLGTGDAELIEGNSWGDTYWGVCAGIGENNLGRILMDIREFSRKFMEYYKNAKVD